MGSVPDWAQPSLLGVTLAGLGEAAAVALRYRVTVTDQGMGVWRHYYWPWYVHTHGDGVTPTDPLLFALNFLTGVVLLLPIAHAVDLLLDRYVDGLPVRRPTRGVFRPGLAKTALALASVLPLSLIGAGSALNLFALPGFLLMLAGIVAAQSVLGADPGGAGVLAVPYGLSLPVTWVLISWVWERRPDPLPAAIDPRR